MKKSNRNAPFLPDIEPPIRHPVTASHFMLPCLPVVEELREGVETACVD